MTSTAGRRVVKLEGALRPREAVLAWLAEAQEVSHIDEMSRQVAEEPIEAAPMSVIARRVNAAVREDMKGKPRDAIEDAVYRATGDALFLFCLIFQVSIHAIETARHEGLRASGVFCWMGCLLGGPRDDELEPDEIEQHHRELMTGWAMWFSVVDRLERDVRVGNQVRTALAERYYAGHDVLFADARSDWSEYAEQVERLKWIADGIASGPSGKVARQVATRDSALPTVEAGVDIQLGWLIDQAKVRAFEVLGERPKAVAIMERRILADGDQRRRSRRKGRQPRRQGGGRGVMGPASPR